MKPNLYVDLCHKGDRAVFREKLDEIIARFPEMTMQSTHREAHARICAATEDLDEWIEITVRDSLGLLMGFAVLTEDDDSHVGPLMGVQWFWSMGYRGVTAMMHRRARELAVENGFKVMGYTKRLDTGRYEINYVKV